MPGVWPCSGALGHGNLEGITRSGQTLPSRYLHGSYAPPGPVSPTRTVRFLCPAGAASMEPVL